MRVCWRPLASMFKLDVPPQDGHSILEREHSASGHAKRASVSVFSSLSHALTKLENIGFTHRTLVGKRHRRGMQLQSVRATLKTRGVPQAQLKHHVIHKNSVHLFSSFVQHLYWYVLCASSSVTPPCSQRVRGGGIALLRYLARILLKSCAQKKDGMRRKTFLKSSWCSFTSRSPSSKFLQASMSSSVARYFGALVHTCLPQNRR